MIIELFSKDIQSAQIRTPQTYELLNQIPHVAGNKLIQIYSDLGPLISIGKIAQWKLL